MSFKLKPKTALVIRELLEKLQILKFLIGNLCIFRAFVNGSGEYSTEQTANKSVTRISYDLSIWLQKL